jgi:Zn-finger nucleic acid-binding protein
MVVTPNGIGVEWVELSPRLKTCNARRGHWLAQGKAEPVLAQSEIGQNAASGSNPSLART